MAESTNRLPIPEPGREAAERMVSDHLVGLFCDEPVGSERFRGGQAAADAALAAFEVARYASRRNDVFPESRRGASALSPYIRHGLLPLRRVWDHVAGGPERDVRKFRDELLWQEFARHWYARHGTGTRHGVRRELVRATDVADGAVLEGWNRDMACMEATVGELERDGWLVNQTRMWLSSDWAVRNGRAWQDGEDAFFTHLLDGSRAANRLGWQWTTGVGSSKHYGFSRWQVEKRAPKLCAGCALRERCPIQGWPDDPEFLGGGARPPSTPDLTGPTEVAGDRDPEVVWLTAESLGDDDPALMANPDLPVVFTFDRALLARLQLSAKRLVFLTETLAEIALHRSVELHLGDPVDALGHRVAAVTHAPVPGHVARVARAREHDDRLVRHPWPWLCRPSGGSVSSFSAWRKSVRSPRSS
ncbi:MAG: FAD-binding domain-containing protein [Ilumatobacter sp.]|uniref:FAD-binding domain-containing protein n=1 Tax=Ilumatobacter sp. TaxID=1967498 RepID=UPI003298BB02